MQGERHQPLLRAVVEVALQAPALLERGLEHAQPRGLQLLARLGALQAQRHELGEVDEAPLRVGGKPVRRRRRDQQQAPDPTQRD